MFLTHISMFLLLTVSGNSLSQDYEYDPYNYDYSYGDPDVDYHDGAPPVDEDKQGVQTSPQVSGVLMPGSPPLGASTPVLPLCCPPGQVYDYVTCVEPKQGQTPRPLIEGLVKADFEYSKGLPSCARGAERIDFFQTEVFFSNTSMYLPRYVQLDVVTAENYCVTKISSHEEGCDKFTTKVFVCLTEASDKSAGMWGIVTVSHLVLVLSLLAYVIVPDLRALQGQYLICVVVSLLLYNICLYPLSILSLHISEVGCMAIKSVKYFFFCTTFLWFNVMSFDLWRTLRCGEDISSVRRFLFYSLYTTLVGASLTIATLVTETLTQNINSRSSDGEVCEISLWVHPFLQFAQMFTLIVNTVMIGLALSYLYNYARRCMSIPRKQASNSCKQSVKLLVIMVFHQMVYSELTKMYNIQFMKMWQFMALEAVAIFGIFVYRKFVIKFIVKRVLRACCCMGKDMIKNVLPNGASNGGPATPLTVMNGTHPNGMDSAPKSKFSDV